MKGLSSPSSSFLCLKVEGSKICDLERDQQVMGARGIFLESLRVSNLSLGLLGIRVR